MDTENENKLNSRRSFGGATVGYRKLGKRVFLTPKSLAVINAPGYEIKHFGQSVSVTVGIGKDHTAELVMPLEAFEALNGGDMVNVSTLSDWEKQNVKRGKG